MFVYFSLAIDEYRPLCYHTIMKGIVRVIGVNMLALLMTSVLIPGFHIIASLPSLFTAGILLTLITFVVKPILQILSLPFTIMTFGLFSIITNAIVIWILQRFVPTLLITTFTIHRIGFSGFAIPKIEISSIILAYIVIAAVLSGITAGINWLMH